MSVQSQLSDLSTRELLDAAAQVRQLQGMPGWRFLHGLIEADIDGLTRRMLNQSLPTHEQFAQIQGELRGLTRLRDVEQIVLAEAQAREAEESELVGGS